MQAASSFPRNVRPGADRPQSPSLTFEFNHEMQPTPPTSFAVGIPLDNPFDLGDPVRRPPFGHSNSEQLRMLDLMNVLAGAGIDNPEADDEIKDCLKAADIDRQLTVTNDQGKTLYEHLMEKGEEVVHIPDLEHTYGFRFAVEGAPPSTNDDQYYKRPVDEAVMKSMSNLVCDADNTLMSLPGVHESQDRPAIADESMCVKQHLAYALGRVINDPNGTQDKLMATVLEIRNRYVEKSVASHRSFVKTAMMGVQSLARLCAVVQNRGNIAESVQVECASIRDLCSNPPKCFLHQLAMQGLSLCIIAGCVGRVANVHGVHGQSMLPPSIGRTVDMIEEFFGNTNVSQRFQAACVAALNLLRQEREGDASSKVWNGFILTRGSESNTPGYKVRGPLHGLRDTNLYVVPLDFFGKGLRIVRLVNLVVELVGRGILAARSVRASILLCSVARARSDKRFLAAMLGHAVPLRDTNIQRPKAICVDKAVANPPAIHYEQPEDTENVPMAIERDYHIVCAMQRVVKEGEILLDRIIDIVTAPGGYCFQHSSRSVQQSVSFIVKKCIQRVQDNTLSNGLIQYNRSNGGSGGSVFFDLMGAKDMRGFLASTAKSMRSGDPAYVKDWHASRSSRNRSKAKAVKKSFGVKEKTSGKRQAERGVDDENNSA